MGEEISPLEARVIATVEWESFDDQVESKINNLKASIKEGFSEFFQELSSTLDGKLSEIANTIDEKISEINELKEHIADFSTAFEAKIEEMELPSMDNIGEIEKNIKNKIGRSQGVINRKLNLIREDVEGILAPMGNIESLLMSLDESAELEQRKEQFEREQADRLKEVTNIEERIERIKESQERIEKTKERFEAGEIKREEYLETTREEFTKYQTEVMQSGLPREFVELLKQNSSKIDTLIGVIQGAARTAGGKLRIDPQLVGEFIGRGGSGSPLSHMLGEVIEFE